MADPKGLTKIGSTHSFFVRARSRSRPSCGTQEIHNPRVYQATKTDVLLQRMGTRNVIRNILKRVWKDWLQYRFYQQNTIKSGVTRSKHNEINSGQMRKPWCSDETAVMMVTKSGSSRSRKQMQDRIKTPKSEVLRSALAELDCPFGRIEGSLAPVKKNQQISRQEWEQNIQVASSSRVHKAYRSHYGQLRRRAFQYPLSLS